MTRKRILSLLIATVASATALTNATAAGASPLHGRHSSGQLGNLRGSGATGLASPFGFNSARTFGLGRGATLGSGPGGSGSALVGSAPTQPGPAGVAVDPATHTIYVANGFNTSGNGTNENTVSVIDSRRCNAQDVSHCKGPWPTITVGSGPSDVAIDLSSDTVYVSNANDNTVSVFNGATCNALDSSGCGQTPATVPVGIIPVAIFDDPANDTVYVANSNYPTGDTVSMIDTTTCNASDLAACPTTAPPTVTVGYGPNDVEVDQATHTVYVAVIYGVSAFDANTCNAIVQSGCSTVGTMPGESNSVYSAKVDAANNTLYTANYDSTISVFDLSQCNASDLAGCAGDNPGTITAPQPFFETDTWVAVDSALHSVYVVYQKDDALLVVNTNTCNGSNLGACATLNPQEIHTGSDPEWVTLDPTTQTLYVSNQIDNDISVIDPTRCDASTTSGCRARVTEVPLGPATVGNAALEGVAADPAVATTYAASGPSTVAMIDTRACNAQRPRGCSATPPEVTAGAYPSAVAVDPLTHTVYVANSGDGPGTGGSVTVIDDRNCNSTGQSGCGTTSTLDVSGGNPDGIAVNPVTDTVYVDNITDDGGPDQIDVFDAATCNATITTGCDQTPATVAIGNDGGPLGATEYAAVDPATNTIYATNVTGGNPFVGDTVYVIDGRSCDAADTLGCSDAPATISVGSDPFFGEANPFGIAVDEDTDTVYTANIYNGEGPGTVSVINGAICNSQNTTGCDQTPAAAPAGFGTVAVAVDPNTNGVYATNIEDASVTTINGNSCNGTNHKGCANTLTQPIVGDYPSPIAVDPSVGTAYVGDFQGVSVMPLNP